MDTTIIEVWKRKNQGVKNTLWICVSQNSQIKKPPDLSRDFFFLNRYLKSRKFYYFFNKSLICVSNSSCVGPAGASGAFSSFFFTFSAALKTTKTKNEIIIKFKQDNQWFQHAMKIKHVILENQIFI